MAQPPSFPTMLEGLKFKSHQHQNGAGQEGVNVTKKLGGAEQLKDFPSLPTGYEVFPGFLVNLSLGSTFQVFLQLSVPPAPAAQFTESNAAPLFSCSSPASSFPACNARVVFKTNENGTQEAE